jgi:hypothetical protein
MGEAVPFCIRQHVWNLETSVVDMHTLRYGREKTEIVIGGYAPVVQVQCTLVPHTGNYMPLRWHPADPAPYVVPL